MPGKIKHINFLFFVLLLFLTSGWRNWETVTQSGVLNVLALNETAEEEQLSRTISPQKYEKNLRAKYGYCRSEETPAYVRNIIVRYENFRQAVETRKAAVKQHPKVSPRKAST